MEIKHFFFNLYGTEYRDYRLVCDLGPSDYSEEKYPVVISSSFEDSLMNAQELRKWCTKNYKPTIGDSIHVVPDSVYPVQDIRNNYKIKRKFDEGVCNVFSPIPKHGKRVCRAYNQIIICDDLKLIICYYVSKSERRTMSTGEIRQKMESLLDSHTLDELHNNYAGFYWDTHFTVEYLRISDSYQKLLLGTAKKPCICYLDLPMNRNELTSDQLFMLYETGKSEGPNAIENYAIQLSALAQTNWKEYPTTMYKLFNTILYWKGAHYVMRRQYQSYPKQIREIMSYSFPNDNFSTEKDYALMKDLLEHILRIGDCKYVTMDMLLEKIDREGIPQNLFTTFYGAMMKITPKKYEAQ